MTSSSSDRTFPAEESKRTPREFTLFAYVRTKWVSKVNVGTSGAATDRNRINKRDMYLRFWPSDRSDQTTFGLSAGRTAIGQAS